jgi:hypothetical protein
MSQVNTVGNFAMVLLQSGDRYGRNFKLTLRGKPEVEFWDLRYPHGPVALNVETQGQFTGGRYYADTIAQRGPGDLWLDMSNWEWVVPAREMGLHVAWLKDQLERVRA